MKIAKTLTVMLLCSLILVLPVSASVSTTELEKSKLNQQEIDLLHQQVLELYLKGESEKVDGLPLVQKYEKIFKESEKMYEQYLSSTDIANTKEVNQKISEIFNSKTIKPNSNSLVKNTVINPKGELVIIMEDGSSALLSSKIYDENNNILDPTQYRNSIAASSEDAQYQYGYNMSGTKAYLLNELKIALVATLKTKAYYTVGSKMDVTSYNISGTKGLLGQNVSVTHTLIGNKSAFVTLQSDFEISTGEFGGNSYYTLYSTFAFDGAWLEDDGYWWVAYTLSIWAD